MKKRKNTRTGSKTKRRKRTLKGRTEFGANRVFCSCTSCTDPCTHIPGYLIPNDLGRMRALAGDRDFYEWAEEHLLASPGAIALKDGKQFRVPTIVPARKPGTMTCHWFEDGRCTIHKEAPFGCAFFKVCTLVKGDAALSHKGVESVLIDHINEGPYSKLWHHLNDKGLTAPPPEKLRELGKIMRELKRGR